MSLAKQFEDVATRLLNKFDERTGDDRIKLLRSGPPIWNPATAQMESTGLETIPVTGVVTNFDNELIDETTILHGDLLLKITSGERPLKSDKVNIDGLIYSVVLITPSRYTNRTIIYSVQVRQ